MTDMQALVLQDALQMDCLRRKMREKILLCLYDYYHREGMAEPLFSLIEQFNPITLKRERIADVAADCIAQGKYEKAQVMLLRYGVPECDKNAFSMLVEALVKEHKDESEPMLVKWALYLYHQGCAGKDAMKYLRRYYTGDLITFTSLTKSAGKCRKSGRMKILRSVFWHRFCLLVPVRSRMSRFIWNIWNRVKTGC